MSGFDELNEIAGDLRGAPDWFQLQARSVVTEAGVRVRDEARRLAPRTRLPKYAEAITTETRTDRSTGSVEAVVGPEKGRGHQGSLGHLLEYGTSRTPPHAHLGPALDREAPRFESDLADLLDPLKRHR